MVRNTIKHVPTALYEVITLLIQAWRTCLIFSWYPFCCAAVFRHVVATWRNIVYIVNIVCTELV